MRKATIVAVSLAVLITPGLFAQRQQLQHVAGQARTLEEIRNMPLSGVLYDQLSRAFSVRDHGRAMQTGEAPKVSVPRPGHFPVETNETVQSTTNIDSDSNRDVEPTIIYQTNGTGSATVVAHTKYVSGNPVNYYYSNKSGGPYTGQLGLATGYTYSGDPWLAEDQSDTSTYARRIYCAGLIGGGTSTTGVGVWTSDNLGQTWSSTPSVVATSTTATIDKPTCDVSSYSSSLGYLYVAYTRLSGSTWEIHAARSTNGGSSFDQDVVVQSSSTHALSMADVIVAPGNGYIYVLWVDFTASPQQIYLARSATSGSLSGSWTIDSGGPTGNFFSSTADTLNGSLRAVTVPQARYNWAATKISVVWHEKEASGSHLADVYYSAKGTGGWQSKVKISNESACANHTDQFMPALDFDANGNLIVSYYDRQRDCNNSLYDSFFTKIDSSGSSLQSPTRISGTQSDPSVASQFIGDYQGMWSDANSPVGWHGAWIFSPSGGNVDTEWTLIQ